MLQEKKNSPEKQLLFGGGGWCGVVGFGFLFFWGGGWFVVCSFGGLDLMMG